MAVYYKFKSAKNYESIPIEGKFISVAMLKDRIFYSKRLGGTDYDLAVTNAQTNEEYVDDATMIPESTLVWIRRVPRWVLKPIIVEPDKPKVVEEKAEVPQPLSSEPVVDPFTMSDEIEWDDFGDDLFAIPDVVHVQPSNFKVDVSPSDAAGEESRFKAVVETSALDWKLEVQDAYVPKRCFGKGRGGRMVTSHVYSHGRLGHNTPPAGYVCYRCNEPGHFIQHCPTNGDPNYDIKMLKPPTGVPKSMLAANTEGSYTLPNGDVATLKPDEAAFGKEIQGLPSNRPVCDLPPELHCPLCKQVMRDAVLIRKCCFSSFCYKCISDYIISMSMCICGVTNILADDLLPNKTLRETITRMESSSSSSATSGSLVQIQDIESAHHVQPKVPSPALSATSMNEDKRPVVGDSSCMKGDGSTSEKVNILMHSLENETIAMRSVGLSEKKKESASHVQPKASYALPSAASKDEDKHSHIGDSPYMKDGKSTSEEKAVNAMMCSKEATTSRRVDLSEKTKELVSEKEVALQEGAPLPKGVQEKMLGDKLGKKTKSHLPADIQLAAFENVGNGNHAAMLSTTSAFNPYWIAGEMCWGFDRSMIPHTGTMPYLGYTPNFFGVPSEGFQLQALSGPQGYKLPAIAQSCREMQREASSLADVSSLKSKPVSLSLIYCEIDIVKLVVELETRKCIVLDWISPNTVESEVVACLQKSYSLAS